LRKGVEEGRPKAGYRSDADRLLRRFAREGRSRNHFLRRPLGGRLTCLLAFMNAEMR
jgi:hypothetical protein